VFAASPWPGAIVTALILIVGLALALNRDLDGAMAVAVLGM
jgi:hypothetical protein